MKETNEDHAPWIKLCQQFCLFKKVAPRLIRWTLCWQKGNTPCWYHLSGRTEQTSHLNKQIKPFYCFKRRQRYLRGKSDVCEKTEATWFPLNENRNPSRFTDNVAVVYHLPLLGDDSWWSKSALDTSPRLVLIMPHTTALLSNDRCDVQWMAT